jgi:hypothetical protein
MHTYIFDTLLCLATSQLIAIMCKIKNDSACQAALIPARQVCGRID